MSYSLQKNYDPMVRLGNWDEQTRELLTGRLSSEIGQELSFRFFDRNEGELLQRTAEVLVGQKADSQRIKFAEIIDSELSGPERGVRYGGNPWPGELYRQGLAELAKQLDQEKGGNVELADDFISRKLLEQPLDPVGVFLKKVLRDAAEILYSHPSSWAEIGFPGPAYPEGYPYLKCSKKEEWEPEFQQD